MPIRFLNTFKDRNKHVAFVFMNHKYPQVGKGAGYVFGAILQAGFPVTFYDTRLRSIDSIEKEIIDYPFDVLMISTMSQFFPEAIELITKVKKCKKILVLVGGIHPTTIGKAILEDHPEIDFLCIGEGESMVTEFLDNLGHESLFNIPNLAYRDNGKATANTMRPPEDLAKLPKFPWHRFQNEIRSKGPYLQASRGCPYRCTFCGNSAYLEIYGKSYLRFRPISDMIDEIEMLMRDFSVRLLFFSDEMILSDFDYITDLLRTVKKRFDVPYALQGRVEHIDEDLVRVLKDTGCVRLSTGVECGNEDFRKRRLNRHMSNKQILSAFSLLQSAGIRTVSNNIIGFPFKEDEFLTKETIEFNLTLHPSYANFNIFYPYPGTKLYQHCVENNLIDPIKQQTHSCHQDSILKGVELKKKMHRIILFLNHKFKPSLHEPVIGIKTA